MAAASAICIMDFGTGNAEICKFIALNLLSSINAQKSHQSKGVLSGRGKVCVGMCIRKLPRIVSCTRTFMFLTECPSSSRM